MVGDKLAPSPVRLPASGGRGLLPFHPLNKFTALGAFLALLLFKKVAKHVRRDTFVSNPHTSEAAVRRAIAAYLSGQMSLEQLDTWLTERTWGTDDAPALAHQAELLIAESARGDREDLAGDLRALAASTADRVPAL